MTAMAFAADALLHSKSEVIDGRMSCAEYAEVQQAYERVTQMTCLGYTVARAYPESYEDLAAAALLANS